MSDWAAPVVAACAGGATGAAVAWASRRLSAGAFAWRTAPVMAFEAMLCGWAATTLEGPWMTALSILLCAALSTLALVDIATFRLPDVITLPLIVAGLAEAALERGAIVGRGVGAVAGFVALWALALGFRRLRGRDGIGMGDAKLLAGAGAWLGWRALPWMVLVACVAAFAWVGVRRMTDGAASLRRPLPFGAPLALSFWVVWLYGAPQA